MVKKIILFLKYKLLIIKNYRWIRNKYLLTFVFFVLWLFFIDDDSFITQYKLSQQLKKLDYRQKRLEKKVEEIKNEIQAYKDNVSFLEKYARENYLMKRDEETIFIFYENRK